MEFEKETALCETVLFLASEPLTVKMLSKDPIITEFTFLLYLASLLILEI